MADRDARLVAPPCGACNDDRHGDCEAPVFSFRRIEGGDHLRLENDVQCCCPDLAIDEGEGGDEQLPG